MFFVRLQFPISDFGAVPVFHVKSEAVPVFGDGDTQVALEDKVSLDVVTHNVDLASERGGEGPSAKGARELLLAVLLYVVSGGKFHVQERVDRPHLSERDLA